MTGFVGASLLIRESFASWSESPVKTTIETLPISEIKLPKVTVCPPRNTFTDLNYDLIMTENMTLTQEMRDEMFKYAINVINADSFSRSDFVKLEEENRFFNWYHGYTKIQSTHKIYNAATSGVVNTQYYGQQFISELVEKKIEYRVHVFPPKSVQYNKNVTLHFSLERVSMTGLTGDSKDEVYIEGFGDLDTDQSTAFTNSTPPGVYRYIIFTQDVSSEVVEQQKLDMMPGFRLSWWYTGAEVTPERRFKNDKITKHFVR